MNKVSMVRMLRCGITCIISACMICSILSNRATAQVTEPKTYEDQLGFAKGNRQFLVFDSLKSRWKSNFCRKDLNPNGFFVWKLDSMMKPPK